MSAQVIPFARPAKVELKCSFCKRPESQVKKLFTNGLEGEDFKSICNDCVAHAKERVSEYKGSAS